MSTAPLGNRLRLLTGPAGSGKTHEALERVRVAATTAGPRGGGARPGSEVLLVLPTYSQALHLERVALSRWGARAVLDAPFATFTSAGERFLPAFRVRALPTWEERDGLMAQALEQARTGPFASVADRPGLRTRLLRLVKEAKQSGEDPARWRERARVATAQLDGPARERLVAFLDVFAAYDELLERAGLEDHEDTLRRLLLTLRSEPPETPPRVLVVDGFDDFTPVEQAILDVLADHVASRGGDVLVTLPADGQRPELFAASAPALRHLRARGFVEERRRGFLRADGVLSHLADHLFAAEDDGAAEEEGRVAVGAASAVRCVVAGDDEDEAEAVARLARQWHADGTLGGWRDLGVVVRRLEDAGGRLAAAFSRLGVPYRVVGDGEPLAREGVVRAWRGPLAVLGGAYEAGRFDAAALTDWARWCAFAGGDARDIDALGALDELEIRWRRRGWPSDLSGWKAGIERAGLDLPDLEGHLGTLASARGAAAVYAALEQAVVGLLPIPAAGGLGADGRPLDEAADERRLRSALARDRLVAIGQGLARAAARAGVGAAVHAPAVRATDAARAVTEAIERARLVVPDRRLDVVNLLDAEEARFWELPVVFVAGCAEGRFPLRATEDVLLRDDERDRLRESDGDLALPLARDREVRERRLFYGAVTRATRRLVLFRPGRDANGNVRPPSLFLRDVGRILDLSAVTEIRPAGRVAPARDECFTVGDWRRFAAHAWRGGDAESRDLACAVVELADPSLLDRAARWRRGEADPLVARDVRARFGASVERVSATGLGAALACRYRFFLRAVVRVPEDDVPLGGPAFDYRDEGTLLHETLRRALLAPEQPSETIVEEVLAWATAGGEGGADLAAPRGAIGALTARELVRVVDLMREREARLASPLTPDPDLLERAFGRDPPLTLGSGPGAFALQGRIDRIDVAGGRGVVIDYKRSPTSVKRASDALAEELDLQLPLYAAAVEALLAIEVVGLEWVAATARYRRGRWSDAAASLAEGRREEAKVDVRSAEAFRALIADAVSRAADVVALLREGDHAKHVDADVCGGCAWRTVCRAAYFSSGGTA